MVNVRAMGVCGVVALAMAGAAAGDTVSIGALKDNTLYENEKGELSNGIGHFFFSGRTFQASDSVRRAVIAFDVASAVPEGSTVTDVTLTLNLSFSISEDVPVGLHRLFADWGEGDSNSSSMGGGTGTAAAAGDATWVHTFFPGSMWANAGGDFAPDPSATQIVGAENGPVVWTGPDLLADVQAWVDGAFTNYGWAVVGDERDGGTAKRFDSRENPEESVRPVLTIVFTPPVAVGCPGDEDESGTVDFTDLNRVLGNFGTECVGRGVGGCPGDEDENGGVNFTDLNRVLGNFGADC